MNNVIIFTNERGGVAVCVPTNDLPIEQVQKKDIPSGVESFIIPFSSLPDQDNDFFDAWEQTNGVVTVNLEKAKEITKNRLRIEREPLLTAQDVAFMRAIETNASVDAVLMEKQRLRDLPALADNCQSLEQLRALKAAKV